MTVNDNIPMLRRCSHCDNAIKLFEKYDFIDAGSEGLKEYICEKCKSVGRRYIP